MKGSGTLYCSLLTMTLTLSSMIVLFLLIHHDATSPLIANLLLGMGMLGIVVAGLFFYRFVRRRQTIQEELVQANQTLEAANQQLSASEQQLKAANQQLSASEQQLKAANQQLQASEQQLKAANQQLAASESALRISEEKYRMIMTYMPSCVAVYEAVDGDDDFIFREFNRAAERIEKTTRDSLLGRRVSDVFPGVRDMGLFKVFQEVWRTGIPIHHPDSIYKDNKLVGWRNNYVYKLPSGEVVAVYTDETERLRAQTLRDRIFNLSLDMITISGMDGFFKELNPAWQKTLGWSNETLLSKPWMEFVHPEDHAETHEARRQLEEGNETIAFENRFQCKDGSFRVLSWNSYPVQEEGLIFAIARDVTQAKRNQEELVKGQRLESLGILAGGIAHDFNNLLGGLFGYLDMALAASQPGTPVYRKLEGALSAFERAKGLTQQLLTFSKGGAPKKNIANLIKLVDEAARLSVSGASTDYHLETSGEICLCEVDEGQIIQVINNVVINARQAMPSGGLIRINLANRALKDEEKSPLPAGNYVEIIVSDTGIGIPQENLMRIFDPFFTTKQMGSGLGLATSFSIIKKHGGHISAESTLGAGTQIHILLPACRGTEGDIKERKPVSAPTPVKGQGRILILDDEPIILEMAQEIVLSLGYEVTGVTTGEKAIEVFQSACKKGKMFDAVVLDLTIRGGQGGIETLQALRKIDPNIKAIVSSGYSDSPVIAKPEEFGFQGIAVKPYRMEEFSLILSEILRK